MILFACRFNNMEESELLRTELARERKARKQAEALLEQKSLEVYERNHELELKAEALKRSNAELEQFAYVASHDLQAPLRTIASFSQLLSKRARPKLDAEEQEYLHFIESGAKRLQQLINDLLQFSRIGRVEYNLSWFSLQELMDDLRLQIQSSLHNARAELVYESLPRVYADRSQLGRVLQNLVDNGIKFQPKSGAKPRVTLNAIEDAQQTRITLSDNGIGIAPEHLGKIFGVFTRLHTQDDYPGTGVGLPICKKIVERHGGSIEVQSEPGLGTRFLITLPKPAAGV